MIYEEWKIKIKESYQDIDETLKNFDDSNNVNLNKIQKIIGENQFRHFVESKLDYILSGLNFKITGKLDLQIDALFEEIYSQAQDIDFKHDQDLKNLNRKFEDAQENFQEGITQCSQALQNWCKKFDKKGTNPIRNVGAAFSSMFL